MASHRWWTVVPVAVGLIVTVGGVAHAGSDEPVDSPEWTEVVAFVDGLQCPDLSAYGLELTDEEFALHEEIVDGIRVPGDQWSLNKCRYQMTDVSASDGNTVSLEVEVLYASEFAGTGCDDERDESPDAGSSKHVQLASISDERAMRLEYWVSHGVLDAAPGIEPTLETALVDFAGTFSSRTAICQYPPPVLTCPDLGEWELTGQYDPEPRALPRLECEYSLYAAREAAEAELTDEERNEQWESLQETYNGNVEFQLLWATDRTPERWYLRACEDLGESPRQNYAVLGGDGVASQAEWYFYGSNSSHFFDPEQFDQALVDLRAQVAEQAGTCTAEQTTSPWSPLPDYLADLFTPERYGTRPIPAQLVGNEYGDLRVAMATPNVTTPVATTPNVADETTPTVAPATTATPSGSPATVPPAAPVAGAGQTGDGGVDAGVDDGGDGLAGSLRTIVVIGALVVSLLGLALAFLLIRREIRVRPLLDVTRVCIVAVTAAVMVLVFSRGAPWWAIAGAILLGGALGWFQGRHLAVRLVDGRAMARRGPIAIVVFGAGLLTTQIAGLLNRTGVIAIGIALSFLSGAITAGLIIGRRPQLVQARRLAGGTAVALVLGGIVAVAPVDQEPADAQADENDLIDLVDWESVEFNAGLFVGEGKPRVEVEVPRAFESPPDPVVRDIEWDESSGAGDPDHFTTTETFTFDLNEREECCSVFYDATGTHIRNEDLSLGTTYTMAGRLDDVDPYGVMNSDSGVPFGEMTTNWWEPDDACRRDIGSRRGNGESDIDTFTVFDHGSESYQEDEPDRLWLSPQFTIGCEVEGFTAEAALAEAELLELAALDERASACPANIEIYPALAEGSELQYESVETVGTLFLEPHRPACTGGGQIGNTLPGQTRSEFGFAFAPPDEQDSETFLQDSTLGAPRPSEVLPEHRCELAPDGRAATIGPDAPWCHLSTWHRLDDQGSWLSIYTNNNYEDGPDVQVRASLPWGDYSYRCHHCEPHSPEITRWIAAMHDFVNGWLDELPDGTVEAGDDNAPGGGQNDATTTGGSDNTGDATPGTETPDGGTTTDGSEASGDDIAQATTLVALLGLLGSGGLLATAIAESGHSPGQLLSTIRNEGYAGLNGLLDLPPDAIVDEYGEVIVADENGLYHYGDQAGTRDEVQEWIAEGQTAIIDRQDEVDGIVTEMYSDEGAAERFEHLATNSLDVRDPITGYTRAEILQEMRDEQASIDHLQSILDQRDAALANLELAWAEQDYEHTRNSWDQITLQALQGMSDEVQALPGEVWDAAVDGTRTVVTGLADPENWQILGETVSETLYDLAGLMAFNSFGDGAESIGDGVRFGGNLTQALANQMVDDPLGTIAMFTGLSDLADSMDPNSTLGQRLGSFTLGVLDIAGNFTGAGLADEALDIARAADRVGDTLDTTRDVTRIADATDDVRDATRIAAATDDVRDATRIADATDEARDAVRTGYAGDLGIARTPDELLDPDLLRKRDEIVIAIRNGDKDQIRALFQNEGMSDMGRLEAAGGLTDEMAEQVVRMHDEITGDAIRLGTQNTIDEFADITNIKPTEVLVGNSGSVGPGRSVLTDADSTVVVVFDDDQLDAWRHTNQVYDGDTFRTPTRLEAQETLQQQFTQMHQDRVGNALNPSSSSTVHLSPDDMDTSSYSGFGSMSGTNDDIYPIGYTTSRQSVQGSTDVYRIDKTGEVSSYSTSGQAIIDQNEITRNRLGNADLSDLTTRRNMTPDQMQELDAYLSNRFSDPTRIDASEMNPLLQQQVHAVEKYDDVKNISKAVDRASFVSSRTGRPLSNTELVDAAVKIRNNPTSTSTVLRDLGMSEQQFNDVCRQMVIEFGAGA